MSVVTGHVIFNTANSVTEEEYKAPVGLLCAVVFHSVTLRGVQCYGESSEYFPEG